MTNFGTYGWTTTKQEDGAFAWKVTGFTYGEGTIVLQSGVRSTRAKAASMAKKWVLYYRRNTKAVA